jgi:hypothetical protein
VSQREIEVGERARRNFFKLGTPMLALSTMQVGRDIRISLAMIGHTESGVEHAFMVRAMIPPMMTPNRIDFQCAAMHAELERLCVKVAIDDEHENPSHGAA